MTEIEKARRVIATSMSKDGLGLLTTSSSAGSPHTAWMATMAVAGESEIVALTSPDSLKVANIRENPQAEWLFTSQDYKHVVYCRGKTDVVERPAEFKAYWRLLEDKGRAYFLHHSNSGPGFAVVRTWVTSVTLTIPEQFQSFDLEVNKIFSKELVELLE